MVEATCPSNREAQSKDAGRYKAARIVINHCLEHKIGRIVFGWNQGIKQEINIGRNNQSFVQIPTAKLKSRMQELCEQYGIQFVETEEANTSAASFLDGDIPNMVRNQTTGSRLLSELNAVCNAAASNFYINADAGRISKYAPKSILSIIANWLGEH